MKGKTWITVNRETLKALLEDHISANMLGRFDIAEWKVKRNGSIEMAITPRPEPAPEAEPTDV